MKLKEIQTIKDGWCQCCGGFNAGLFVKNDGRTVFVMCDDCGARYYFHYEKVCFPNHQ